VREERNLNMGVGRPVTSKWGWVEVIVGGATVIFGHSFWVSRNGWGIFFIF
jgi:hypothetical protein